MTAQYLLEKLTSCRMAFDPTADHHDNAQPGKVALMPPELLREVMEFLRTPCS